MSSLKVISSSGPHKKAKTSKRSLIHSQSPSYSGKIVKDERKLLIKEYPHQDLSFFYSGGGFNLFDPIQGTRRDEVVGNKARVKSIHLRILVTFCPMHNRSNFTPNGFFRSVLMIDEYPHMGPLKTIPSNTCFGFEDPAMGDNFKVLDDKLLKLKPGHPIPMSLEDPWVLRRGRAGQGQVTESAKQSTFDGELIQNARGFTGKMLTNIGAIQDISDGSGGGGGYIGVHTQNAIPQTDNYTISQAAFKGDARMLTQYQGGLLNNGFIDPNGYPETPFKMEPTSLRPNPVAPFVQNDPGRVNDYQWSQNTTWSGDSQVLEIFLDDLDIQWTAQDAFGTSMRNQIKVLFSGQIGQENYPGSTTPIPQIRVKAWSKVTFTDK